MFKDSFHYYEWASRVIFLFHAYIWGMEHTHGIVTADFPNFASELGYTFDIDLKASETMKEFFETNRDNNTRRSFHTVSRLTIEAGRVEYVDAASAEVEPISRGSLDMAHI